MTLDLKEELASLLWAGVPLVNLVTYEEERVARLLTEIDGGENLGIVTWDLADGFRTLRHGKESFPIKNCTSDTVLELPDNGGAGRRVEVPMRLNTTAHGLWGHKRRTAPWVIGETTNP